MSDRCRTCGHEVREGARYCGGGTCSRRYASCPLCNYALAGCQCRADTREGDLRLRPTVEALGKAADAAQQAIDLLVRLEHGSPAGATRDVAENAQLKLRQVQDACVREAQQLRKVSRAWCDGEGCDELLYVDELQEQPDGDLLCGDCVRVRLENDEEREGVARANDLFNGGGIGK